MKNNKPEDPSKLRMREARTSGYRVPVFWLSTDRAILAST